MGWGSYKEPLVTSNYINPHILVTQWFCCSTVYVCSQVDECSLETNLVEEVCETEIVRVLVQLFDAQTECLFLRAVGKCWAGRDALVALADGATDNPNHPPRTPCSLQNHKLFQSGSRIVQEPPEMV